MTAKRASRDRTEQAAAFVFALTLAVFWPVLGHGFLELDDYDLLGNPHVRAGLTFEGVRWAFSSYHFWLWHPLTSLSHMLDCQLYGPRPWGHHATSLLLHATNAALFFAFLSRTTGDLMESLIAACLFAVHPLRVESVAWVAERKDVLSLFFWLLASGAYVRWTARPSPGRYVAALALYAAALMAKPMAVTFPLALLLLDFWPLGRLSASSLGARVREKIPFGALAAAVCAVTLRAQAPFLSSTARFPLWLRLLSAPFFYAQYLGNTAWPARLSIYYAHPGLGLSRWKAVAAAGLVLGATAAAYRARRKAPFLLTGWMWFLVTLLPVIGLVQLTTRSIANRYTYLPHLGLCIAAAWAAGRWSKGRPECRRGLAVAAGILVAVLSLLTRRELRVWGEPRELYRRALETAPDNELLHNILGVRLASEGDPAAARAQFLEAIRVDPAYADAHNNLGYLLARQGDFAAAAAQYREALRLEPAHVRARANLAALLKSEAAGSPQR